MEWLRRRGEVKIWAWIILAGIIVGALGVSARLLWQSGWNARDVQVQQEIIEAQEQARKQEAENWRETVRQAEENIRVVEKRVTDIQEIEKRIPVIVEKVVEVKPECRDLGDDFARLLNSQIRAATGRDSAETSTGVAP